MTVCPSCATELPEGSRFCLSCGARLAAPAAAAEERKVVTTLFCDLVASTAMSESADPEDVDALLRRYDAVARRVVESHGGTVEKFIGDAVVAVFGVPAVHEDDPERAVRAGLRIVQALAGLTLPDGSALQVRIGVNTGEALVRLDVTPGSGEGFLTGDAVNVAARLQAAAPPGGVAVGATSHEYTANVIEYEELPPVVAKGKAEPILAWRATATRARRGIDVHAGDLSPLVGREVELSYLTAIFEKAAAQSSSQFVLIVGEPGIGKSRLVRELLAIVDARPQMTTWRQGFCPPFGENITYWALAEIVKGHAGIRDTDDGPALEAKLDAVLPSGPDREWFRQRLRALLGLAAPEASREQNFASWLRFFEDLAASEPTVLVFEDLHWADEALLDFLEYLTTHLAAVPLLIVGTARPELFERQPGFASGSGATRIGLGPLSRGETTRLVTGLLGEPDDRAKAVREVVERCDGNPFYAEQSARLLTDSLLGVALPDSVHAVIAARLDTLPASQKALLGDAAVIGSAFWDGAVVAMGPRDPQELEGMLSSLLELHLIRRIRESSMDGECEFAFVHALARDVAYRQLPRAARARKHVAVAAWLEHQTGARAADLAEVLAYHLATAFALAEALQDDGLAAEIRASAVTWLRAAGDRAQSVDVATARRHYERALEIASAGDAARARLLLGLGEMLVLAGDYDAAAAVLEEAASHFTQQDDMSGTVRSLLRLHFVLAASGRPRPELVAQALALARSRPPSPELVDALDSWAWNQYLTTGNARVGLDAIDEALAICEEQGFDVPASVLATRGGLRCALWDVGGLVDQRRAVQIAQDTSERGFGFELSSCMWNCAVTVYWVEGPKASDAVLNDCIDLLERRGMLADARFMRSMGFESRLMTGDWATLPEDIVKSEHDLPEALVPQNARTLKAIQLLVGERVGRLDVLEEALASLETLRSSSPAASPWEDAYDAVPSAVGLVALGRTEAAVRWLTEWATTPRPASTVEYAWMVPEAVRLALRCSGLELAERLGDRGDGLLPVQQHVMATVGALLAEARGAHESAAAGFADAAARWRDFMVPYEEGHALLGQGRCLAALGRAPEAAAPLAAARVIFARLGAKPALAETDALLRHE